MRYGKWQSLTRFVEMTVRAMNGERLVVLGYDARDSKREFEEYVLHLRASKKDGYKVFCAVGRQHVDFDGGGSVRFASSSRHVDGANIYESKLDEFLR